MNNGRNMLHDGREITHEGRDMLHDENEMLHDAHCHLDFCDNCEEIAGQVEGRISAICATVLPSSFVSAKARLADFTNIKVALGLHPWEVAESRIGEVDLESFENLLEETSIIAEIGLDYSKDRNKSRTHQIEVLARLLDAIANSSQRKTIFLHAVKSYSDVFKLLDDYKICENHNVVFHWFQGTPDDFGRAIALGCSFSVGMKMTANDSGAMFAQAIPDELLLAETDSPARLGLEWSAESWVQLMNNTVDSLARVRETSREELMVLLAANTKKLLS